MKAYIRSHPRAISNGSPIKLIHTALRCFFFIFVNLCEIHISGSDCRGFFRCMAKDSFYGDAAITFNPASYSTIRIAIVCYVSYGGFKNFQYIMFK